MVEYTLIRSSRKTVAIQVDESSVTVRAPYHLEIDTIDQCVKSREKWIKKQLAFFEEERENPPEGGFLSDDDIRALTEEAKKVVPQRVAYYAPLVGVTYGRVTIRHQKTRWGSCSSKGNLNFNCLLMLAPPEVLDSIVVHELCHRKVMNHSKAFYDEVYRVFPEYNNWDRWLKENGRELLRRMR